jgi:putative transposase
MSGTAPILAAAALTRTELDVQRGYSTVYTLHAHPVFVTNYRRPVFTGDMLTSCQHLTADICLSSGSEFNGQTDHVHLLIHDPASHAVSTWLNPLKGVSSHRLHQQFPPRVWKYQWAATSVHRPTSPPPTAAHH